MYKADSKSDTVHWLCTIPRSIILSSIIYLRQRRILVSRRETQNETKQKELSISTGNRSDFCMDEGFGRNNELLTNLTLLSVKGDFPGIILSSKYLVLISTCVLTFSHQNSCISNSDHNELQQRKKCSSHLLQITSVL